MKFQNRLTLLILSIVLMLNSNLFPQGDVRGSVIIFPQNDIQVSLINQSGIVVNRTMTDNNGRYYFRHISVGNYKLEFHCDYIKPCATSYFYVPVSGMHRNAEQLSNQYNAPGLIALLYCFALFAPDEFPDMVIALGDRINSDRQILQSIDRISNAFLYEASMQPSQREIISDAVAAGIPREEAERVYSQQSSPAVMGLHFAEMSQSIRQILAGNTRNYRETQLYQYGKFLATMLAMTNSMSQLYGSFINIDQLIKSAKIVNFYYTLAYARLIL